MNQPKNQQNVLSLKDRLKMARNRSSKYLSWLTALAPLVSSGEGLWFLRFDDLLRSHDCHQAKVLCEELLEGLPQIRLQRK
jgi:hypothetical protein